MFSDSKNSHAMIIDYWWWCWWCCTLILLSYIDSLL